MRGEGEIKKVGTKALATIALISLLVGLGVGQSLDRFPGTRLHNVTGSPEIKRVPVSQELPNFVSIIVARTPVGKKVPVKVLRDKKEASLFVTLGELKEALPPKKKERLG